MKISWSPALIPIILCLFCLAVRAGDFATLNFIGFSKDGKYLAFEEHGVQDGSGFPYSNIYFVDVAKNSFAAPPVRVRIERETATEPQARAKAKLGAAASIKKFRIIERNRGTLVVSRLLTDLTAYDSGLKDEGQKINFAEMIWSMYRQGNYDLILRSLKVEPKECDYSYQPVYKLELELKDNSANSTIVLQKDTTLPASRDCPTRYTIQYVYLYESFIAVFLNTYHIGFEGPDMRFLVITGKYK